MCHTNAGSGINTAFWQCVLHLDWKKPLVNVITVFYFLIMLGFSNGRNVPFENKAEETRYANTVSQHEASAVTSDSQEQFPSFSSCRADEG